MVVKLLAKNNPSIKGKEVCKLKIREQEEEIYRVTTSAIKRRTQNQIIRFPWTSSYGQARRIS